MSLIVYYYLLNISKFGSLSHLQVVTFCKFCLLLIVTFWGIWNFITFVGSNILQFFPTTASYMLQYLEQFSNFCPILLFAYCHIWNTITFVSCNNLQLLPTTTFCMWQLWNVIICRCKQFFSFAYFYLLCVSMFRAFGGWNNL